MRLWVGLVEKMYAAHSQCRSIRHSLVPRMMSGTKRSLTAAASSKGNSDGPRSNRRLAPPSAHTLSDAAGATTTHARSNKRSVTARQAVVRATMTGGEVCQTVWQAVGRGVSCSPLHHSCAVRFGSVQLSITSTVGAVVDGDCCSRNSLVRRCVGFDPLVVLCAMHRRKAWAPRAGLLSRNLQSTALSSTCNEACGLMNMTCRNDCHRT